MTAAALRLPPPARFPRNAHGVATVAQRNPAAAPMLGANHHKEANMKTTVTPLPEPTESEIQHAAYYLWLENGKPEGCDLETWFAAKELLRHRHAPATKGRRGMKSTVPPPVPTGR
jgi:hypothetical protein